MTKEEFMAKLQMVYVGDKNAFDELVSMYDNLKQKIDKALKLAEDLEDQIELTWTGFNKDKTYENAYEHIEDVGYHYEDIQEIVLVLKGEMKKMLKIREEIDLKELEKYGFELDYFKNYEKKLKGDKRFGLTVSKDNKSIFFEDEDCNKSYDLDTLYDLIKDGLIEKINK